MTFSFEKFEKPMIRRESLYQSRVMDRLRGFTLFQPRPPSRQDSIGLIER
jgi:hypothetical protein